MFGMGYDDSPDYGGPDPNLWELVVVLAAIAVVIGALYVRRFL
jgi:hypothetical protein